MDATKVPVPGQMMDLELSDGEGAEIVPPKRKEQRGVEAASPAKRGAPDVDVVSLAMLRSVLNEQTQELKGNLKLELGAAIEKSENKMMGMVAQVKQDLEAKMEGGAKELEEVKQIQNKLLTRVAALEEGSSSSAGGPGLSRRPTILFGGWKADTKKAVILADIDKALNVAKVRELVDQPPWVPGARHSVGLSEIRPRVDESEAESEKRVLCHRDAE